MEPNNRADFSQQLSLSPKYRPDLGFSYPPWKALPRPPGPKGRPRRPLLRGSDPGPPAPAGTFPPPRGPPAGEVCHLSGWRLAPAPGGSGGGSHCRSGRRRAPPVWHPVAAGGRPSPGGGGDAGRAPPGRLREPRAPPPAEPQRPWAPKGMAPGLKGSPRGPTAPYGPLSGPGPPGRRQTATGCPYPAPARDSGPVTGSGGPGQPGRANGVFLVSPPPGGAQRGPERALSSGAHPAGRPHQPPAGGAWLAPATAGGAGGGGLEPARARPPAGAERPWEAQEGAVCRPRPSGGAGAFRRPSTGRSEGSG